MPFYVLAFTDRRIRRAAGDPPFQNVEIDGIVAVGRRRQAVPMPTDETLRRQHRDVLQIARGARAVLPVRFGALIAKAELVDRVRSHHDVLREALAEVRDRTQMTVRILGTAPPRVPARQSSGRQYLEDRRRALVPELPAEARAVVDAVRPFAVRERQEPGAAGLLATIYHLVPVADTAAYASRAAALPSSTVIVSGPWPPFAFTPQLW